MTADQHDIDAAFITAIAELIRSSVEDPQGGGVSRLITECYFTFRYCGEDGLILTDDLRAGVEALLGEKLVEHMFDGFEGERFLVPASAAGAARDDGSSQLAAYVKVNGPHLALKRRALTVEGIEGQGGLAIGTFRAARASYLGVLCVNARVLGHPGAEVWSVLSGQREVVRFAVAGGLLLNL